MESKGEIAAVVDTDWRKLWQLRFDDPLVDAETLKLNINGTIRELGKKPKNYEEIEAQYIGMIKVSASAQNRFYSFFILTITHKSIGVLYLFSFL